MAATRRNVYPILGGTFDPVHLGHLHAARAGGAALGASCVTLLLAARPWHRAPPQASARDRAAMLRLAVDDANAGRLPATANDPPQPDVQRHPTLRASEQEGVDAGPSYTVSTLAAIGGGEPLVWLLGDDALASIGSWHRVSELAALCHLLVFRRAGAAGPDPTRALGFRPVASAAALGRHRCGRVHHLAAPTLDISATRVRERIAGQADASALLPARVWAYIRRRGLYGAARTPRPADHALGDAAGGGQ